MIKFRLIYFLFLAILSFVSCKSDEINYDGIDKQESIFNLNTLLSEEENDISFPIWYNDSFVKAHGIHKIIRKTYPLNNQEDAPLETYKNTSPRETKEYLFDNNGAIYQLNVHYSFDDREIGSVLFTYSGKKDASGYMQVSKKTIVNKTAKRITETHEFNDPEIRELFFKMHVKRKGSKKYLAYQDMETGDFLYYILNSKYWGTLSVDSILKPNPKDIVCWGNPLFPSKKYQVFNKVNEKNVKEFIYDSKNTKLPLYWIKKDYPFDIKRTFVYSKTGLFQGYIDSTFADQNYVTRIVAKINFNQDNEPVKIIHKKENQSEHSIYYSIETFSYEK